MKQLVVISGKGGTGKTVLTSAFCSLAQNPVMVDCDVDASDLHLLLRPSLIHQEDFQGGQKAWIDPSLCIQCHQCRQVCRFQAISNDLQVNELSCEGCGFCKHICPVGCIEMKDNISGQWFISQTRFGGPLIHAQLKPGEDHSGKLASCLRQKAKEMAEKDNHPLIIIDGPPGIGCPVMASLSGVDHAVLITEPTLSGLHDIERLMDLCAHFKIPISLVVNKWDLNPDMTEKIEFFAKEKSVHLLGRITFHRDVIASIVSGKTLMETDNQDLKMSIENIWQNLIQVLF